MSGTSLSVFGTPHARSPTILDKAAGGLPNQGIRVSDFDTFRQGYAEATVEVMIAGTTDHAPLFFDLGLSRPAPNPQTLIAFTDINGTTYGKWARPIYTYVPFTCLINDTDSTGVVQVALTDLAGQDASLAIAAGRRGSYALTIGDWLDREVYAGLFGTLDENAGSGACTATLIAAIGAAAAQGGGVVTLPAGTIPITALVLPEGVILTGKGPAATTLLSLEAQPVITLAGDGSGLAELTLDGVNVNGGSVGVFGVDVDMCRFERVLIKRFDVGVQFRGLANSTWRDLSVSNCNTNIELRGDSDAIGSNAGAAISNIRWEGGFVSLATSAGLSLNFIDLTITDVTLVGVQFDSNLGQAIKINGARRVTFEGCSWSSNLTNVLIQDDQNLAKAASNTVQQVLFESGSMNGGALTFDGTCEDVALRRLGLFGVSFNLTVPRNGITVLDCIEDAATTATGDLTKLLRQESAGRGRTVGVTADSGAAVTITAWSLSLDPGQVVLLEAKIIARARNNDDYGVFWIAAGAFRPAAVLPVQLMTGSYTPGLVVTGQRSGASARVTRFHDDTGSGSLALRDITGTFLQGEKITDTQTGSGLVGGALQYSNSSIDGGGVTVLRPAQVGTTFTPPDTPGYNVNIDTFGDLLRVRVTGATGHYVEWTVEVDLTEP